MIYDLFSLTFKANPFSTFARMRQNAPIYAHKTPKGDTVWYITRYQDVIQVLKDHQRFVKNYASIHPPVDASRTPNIHQAINQNMLFSDPPDHTRLRALVNLAFTPRRVAEMAPRIEQIATDLLDQAEQQGHMDLIAAYALPLPITVIAEMLGLPKDDWEQVFSWSQAIISPSRYHLTFRARRRKVKAFVHYLQAKFEQRRQNPGDDLISALVQAEQAGDRLSELELSSMVALLFVTGHETTVNLIGNGVLALLQNPAQLALLQAKPSLMASAVEELLRYDGPVETSTTRWAKEDVLFQGHLIRRGDIVRVVLTSANRDQACCEEPHQLNIARTDNKHVAFGHGIHYCLGASLARLEGQIALTALLKRFPDLRLAQPTAELQWHSGVLFRGLKALPLIWL